jgi:outer membrane protein OmpA-like peptidoglycan-associated protein
MKNMTTPLIVIGMVATLAGCATEKFVNQQISSSNAATSARASNDFLRLDTRLSSLDTQLASLDSRVNKTEGSLGAVSRLAQEALDRAKASNQVLPVGKLAFEVTLTDSQIKFPSGKAVLPKGAEQILVDLVKKLKADNQNVYIEIQGHTDNVGAKEDNKQLGLERAQIVRDFLHTAGLPLHRLNVISYGSSQPAVPGKDAKARAQNRRVVLMVLV